MLSRTAIAVLALSATAAAQQNCKLRPTSLFEDGCHPPCACPYFVYGEVAGTFMVRLVERNFYLERYAIENIDWTFPSVNWRLTGHGEYRLEGDFLLTQHIDLYLVADNGREYHLESNSVPPPVSFPRIQIDATNRVGEGCVYALLQMDATCRCVADFNQDGGVDGGDVEAFFTSWEDGLRDADVNDDGGVDGADVQEFFVDWERGSC